MSQICSYFYADVFIITYKYSYINTFRKMTQGSEVKWGGGYESDLHLTHFSKLIRIKRR